MSDNWAQVYILQLEILTLKQAIQQLYDALPEGLELTLPSNLAEYLTGIIEEDLEESAPTPIIPTE